MKPCKNCGKLIGDRATICSICYQSRKKAHGSACHCGRKLFAVGLCNKHYFEQWRKKRREKLLAVSGVISRPTVVLRKKDVDDAVCGAILRRLNHLHGRGPLWKVTNGSRILRRAPLELIISMCDRLAKLGFIKYAKKYPVELVLLKEDAKC